MVVSSAGTPRYFADSSRDCESTSRTFSTLFHSSSACLNGINNLASVLHLEEAHRPFSSDADESFGMDGASVNTSIDRCNPRC